LALKERGKGFAMPTILNGRRAMLVLTRGAGERVVIQGNIRVTVVAIQGDHVRLGITAPRETLVDRQEVRERRIAEKHTRKPGKEVV